MISGMFTLSGRTAIITCASSGIGSHVKPVGDAISGPFERIFAVHVRNTMVLTAALAPATASRGKEASSSFPASPACAAIMRSGSMEMSKATLTQLAATLPATPGPSGARMNAISPELVRTSFAEPIFGDPVHLDRWLGVTPLRHLASRTRSQRRSCTSPATRAALTLDTIWSPVAARPSRTGPDA